MRLLFSFWLICFIPMAFASQYLDDQNFDTICDDYRCKKERYDQRKEHEEYDQPVVTAVDAEKEVCRYFSSTESRRLKIEKRIAKGMTEAQVRASWGNPSQVDQLSDEQSQWFYRRFGESYFLTFLNGCLQGWR
ncbi:hypothetical protein ACFOEK_17790 [Litoribrevibacter euphylliae]|uniref:DUF1311 domain-containing protein n=1 Tax=Litoribrevibacter euphylliae TaxID=1834034 RepID=A0ABV7HJA0_9GAMM